MQANIDLVLAHRNMGTKQRFVGINLIESVIRGIKSKAVLPPVVVYDYLYGTEHDAVIQDGNHRYIAYLLCHKEPVIMKVSNEATYRPINTQDIKLIPFLPPNKP